MRPLADESQETLPPQPGPNTLRDHLANERTFLAWMRTVIAIIALGFVVAKFGIVLREQAGVGVTAGESRAGAVVGVILIAGGALTAGLATLRFLQVRRDIDNQLVNFRPQLDVILAAVVGLTSVILAVYIAVTS
jgi:putative membrane protein